MLTPSVNVVQSSFPEDQQGEISGLSRSVSNLGSSLGMAVAGTVLVAGIANPATVDYALALVFSACSARGAGRRAVLPSQPAGSATPSSRAAK